MGKKGVSFEEKRERMLKIFYDRVSAKQKEVFNLKELETLGNKVGVISNTVKDVVQSLLDDNLVETDKIGAGNFLWALPSKGRQIRVRKLEELKNSMMDCKTQKKSLGQQIENQLKSKPDSSDRLEKLQALKELKSNIAKSKALKESLKSCTKAYYDECSKEAQRALDSANIHTDNIFSAKSYLQSRNPGLSSSDINKFFSIPEDLDNI